MTASPHHPNESPSNATRDQIARFEPKTLRTYTPTQAVLARSAGIYHWTPEGRRLYDFTSGVLVANLGHNPQPWLQRLVRTMGWPVLGPAGDNGRAAPAGYCPPLPPTAHHPRARVAGPANPPPG